MKEQDKYETPKSSSVMRFLWKCAGGDRYFLERSTYSDQVKYACLGGIIIATAGMAMLSGGYAFYTIFSPKGNALNEVLSTSTLILSAVFGIIWGLIIFNIDRFIVTSTGKGDGTEKITWDEFKGAIPRIIMGIIIAITISKPIEIRMFKTEINSELHERQLKKEKDYEIRTRNNFRERLKDLEKEINEIQPRRDDYFKKIAFKDSLYNIEMTEGNGGRGEGEGPVALALKAERVRLTKELDNFNLENKEKSAAINIKKNKINNELDSLLKLNKKVSDGLDGLLERISILHEIASKNVAADGKITHSFPWIIFFVTMLFITIELTPIFFKLMLTKTPYDYLTENRDDIIKAEYGIEVRYDYYKDKQGQERHLVINHEAERVIYEKIKITEIQKELTDYAIKKYKAQEKEKIDANLKDYIKKIETNNTNDEETTG